MLTIKQSALRMAVGAVALIATGAAVNAASLVTFTSSPTTPNLPEFAFTNDPVPQFVAGPGSTGNGLGDGILPTSAQLAGGLAIQTPLHIVSPVAIPLTGGETEFDDVTLVISNLAASTVAFPGGADPGDVIVQPLGKANILAPTPTFSLFATSLDANPLDGQLLLTGTITHAAITALNLTDTASVLSSSITYTGGAIFDALSAIPGSTTTGSLSWSLLDIEDSLGNPSVSINGATNFFTSFTSNGAGLFNTAVVPEPTSAAIVGIPALAMLVQRRRSSRA